MSVDEILYQVVVNAEGQYSIWPADETPPDGWETCGVSGPRADCVAHIERVWTDMRPLSLQRAMAEQERPLWASTPIPL